MTGVDVNKSLNQIELQGSGRTSGKCSELSSNIVCPISLDPICIVTILYKMSQVFLTDSMSVMTLFVYPRYAFPIRPQISLFMVLILDGIPEFDKLVHRETGKLTPSRHLAGFKDQMAQFIPP